MRAWFVVGLFALAACDRSNSEPESWEVVHEELPGALLSVWGASSTDVWSVGGDARDGTGPLVLHYDGEQWQRVSTDQTEGNLWWVFGFEDGPIYAGGDGGVILRYQDGSFTQMDTPGNATVFGIWGASPDDVWAVGGASDAANGFAWRLTADTWTPEPSLPAEVPDEAAIWKVFGTAADDAWLVGSNGVALHWDGNQLTRGDTGVGASLFTVHASGGRYVAVGGTATGIIVEYDGAQWTNVTPEPPPQGLTGVFLAPEGGDAVAAGLFGTVYTREDGQWQLEDPGLRVRDDFHAAFIDDEGGIWVVGGQTLSYPLTDGIMIHRGQPVAGGDI